MGDVRFVAGIVVVLGVMVLVHEFGHFVVAKLFGVQVDIFSIGFGPRLFGWRRGDTDYRVSALPLGGYVKMAGDNPVEERSGSPKEFLSKPRWQRALIILAGPTMNLISTLILFTWIFTGATMRQPYLDLPAEVAGVPHDSPTEKAGLQPGDRIVEIDGTKTPNWEKAEDVVKTVSPESEVSVTVDRDGQPFSVTMRAGQMRSPCDIYNLTGYPPDPWVVTGVTLGGPAERSGIRVDDRIEAVDGERIVNGCQFVPKLNASGGHPLQIDVRRGDQLVHLQVHAAKVGSGASARWQIGITWQPKLIPTSRTWTESAKYSSWYSVRLTRQVVSLIGNLFRGRVSLKEVSGPIGIMTEAGRAAKRGLTDMLFVMAFVGLNLGILNLLPIPILDGGHLLMLAVEGSIGRDLSLKMKERFVQVGMVFLLVVFAIVMYNDVLRLIPSR
jgi:regulator of sigma E protease